MTAIRVVTAPAAEPVSLADMKAFLRVDASDEDALISSLIKAAREWAEDFTQRAFINRTLELVSDIFPSHSDPIMLGFPPVSSIVSAKWIDETGTQTTFIANDAVQPNTLDVTVDMKSHPARIALNSGATWPSDVLVGANGLVVRYVAGYGPASANVPEQAALGIKLLVANWHENREPVVIGKGAVEIPINMQAVFRPLRVQEIAA